MLPCLNRGIAPTGRRPRPQCQPRCAQGARQQGVHRLVCRAEAISGHARIEMMDGVEADVAGQPVQEGRQAEPGRSLQRGVGEAPNPRRPPA